MKLQQFARLLLVGVLALLAACGAPAVATVAPSPTATAVPPTHAPTALTATPVTIAITPADNPMLAIHPTGTPTANAQPLAPSSPSAADTPNDTTQARLRVSNCAAPGPRVDIVVNGQVAVNGGVAQADLGSGAVSGYLYLAPSTYQVAVVPTGQDNMQALLGPLAVPVVAGHRYTLAVMGHAEDAHHTPLLIDETAAYLKAGAAPTSSAHLTINNVKGAQGISFLQDGMGANAPAGGFVATAMPTGAFKTFDVAFSGPAGQAIDKNGAGFNDPGTDNLDCFHGTYPGARDTWTSPVTSNLNVVAFLKGFHGLKDSPVTFDTLLAALARTGLDKLLTTGGPYLLFAPTDAAFAALPQAQRDALLADPTALAALLRAHMVQGYYPPGSLGSTPDEERYNRTVTNLLGAPLALRGGNGTLYINEAALPYRDSRMVANGSRVIDIATLLQPTPETTAQKAPGVIQFRGHSDELWEAEFSPDGKTIITASADGTARTWDAATGKQLRSFSAGPDIVHSAVFSPDGKLVLTCGADKTARLWDAATGKQLRVFTGATDEVRIGAFAHDSKTIIATSYDGIVRLWATATGKELRRFTGHAPGHANRLGFTADGQTMVTSGDDQTARVWDLRTGKALQVLRGHTGMVTGVSISPDGAYVVTASGDGTARLWAVASGKEVRRFVGHTGAVLGAKFSRDGKTVITSGEDGTVRLWEVASGKELRRFTGPTDRVRDLAFSPDGTRILAASSDHIAWLWQIAAGTPAP